MKSPPAFVVASLILNVPELLVHPSPEGPDWEVAVSVLPEDPDEFIVVYDTAGVVDGKIMRTGETVMHEGIQIRVRSVNYSWGWGQADKIIDYLTRVHNVEVSVEGILYRVNAITRSSGITSFPEEETRDRRSFTVNALVSLTRM